MEFESWLAFITSTTEVRTGSSLLNQTPRIWSTHLLLKCRSELLMQLNDNSQTDQHILFILNLRVKKLFSVFLTKIYYESFFINTKNYIFLNNFHK